MVPPLCMDYGNYPTLSSWSRKGIIELSRLCFSIIDNPKLCFSTIFFTANQLYCREGVVALSKAERSEM